ncbi:hypothetical protein ccrud_10025 [Corynebacterium crudilactis]|uniref:DUF218 domain-containing protein n=1 Tax=Corynebacterium crudilactis TaxID=1652495 RepID=A0A172QUX4_9CORY|nr:hypothetical protein ccrud_10025 [Corynebacterium crudilactis]
MAAIAQPALRVALFAQCSTPNDQRSIDSIVVLGTAQYDGRPSKQFEARLKHTATLWQLHHTQSIYTVGGKLPGDRFTEAEVARDYLIDAGVEPALIVVSAIGNDTASSFAALSPAELGRVLIVTDPNHSYRAVRMARRMGFEAYPSPTTCSPTKFPSIVYFLTLSHEWGGIVVQDVSYLFGKPVADKVEEGLRFIQGLLRPSRRARHEQLRRLKK